MIHNTKSNFLATLPSFMNQTGHGIAPSAIPWQVSIRNHWKPHFCSGVILDHKTVLSSANCFKKLKTLKGIRVMAGDVNYKLGQNIGVRKLRFLNHNEDLVILKLVSSLHMNENVLPACLPESSAHYEEIGVTSGWEMTDGNKK